MCIKQYMHSPVRGDPLFEEVMLELLRHGAGIEDWRRVCAAILQYQMPRQTQRKEMLVAGYTESEIEEELRRMETPWSGGKVNDYVLSIMRHSRLADPGFIRSLFDIPLYVEPGVRFFGDVSTLPSHGEPILRDEDWMDDFHRAAVPPAF